MTFNKIHGRRQVNINMSYEDFIITEVLAKKSYSSWLQTHGDPSMPKRVSSACLSLADKLQIRWRCVRNLKEPRLKSTDLCLVGMTEID